MGRKAGKRLRHKELSVAVPPEERDRAIRTDGSSRLRRWTKPLLVTLVGFTLLLWLFSRPGITSVASGLDQPRGLAFDKSGNLYVASVGGVQAAANGESVQDTNHSGQIIRIAPDQTKTVLLDRLPFTRYPVAGDVGAADVTLVGDTVYVLTGEGYDDQLSRAVLRAVPGAAPEYVASILNFAQSIVPLDSLILSGGLPSNPYALVAAPDGQTLYVSDGASGHIFSITLDGRIRIFATLPNMPPLAGLAWGPDGRLYVAMFSSLPHAPGSGAIYAADADGTFSMVADGLTMPIDVGFDAAGTMYVLEFGSGQNPEQPYAPGGGRLLRREQHSSWAVVLDRLDYPTAMAFSPSGDVYLTVNGAFTQPKQGSILRIPCRSLGLSAACTP